MPNIAVATKEKQLSLKHLQTELTRIDLIIGNAVQRWQLAGQDTTDQFRGLYISPEEAAALVKRPMGSSWGTGISLSSKEAQGF